MQQLTIPGKLIISGEHAVVYGSPALAAAIDRYIHVRVNALEQPLIELGVADYQAPLIQLSVTEFWQQTQKLSDNYQEFLQGKRNVTEITTHLYDLPFYALGLFLQHTGLALNEGIRLSISGDLPMGYGMGSSAAVVIGILRAANLFFKQALSMSELQKLAIQVENLQHGHASGLDTSVCLHEGVILYEQQNPSSRSLPQWPVYLINTGQPQSSTGECVAHVREQKFTQTLWEQFAQVTLTCEQALQTQNVHQLQMAIQQNHQLLCQLGVVPARIQSFVASLQRQGAAAKICGAGCIRGDSAGYLLVLPGDALPAVEALTHEYGFTLEHAHLGVTPNSYFISCA